MAHKQPDKVAFERVSKQLADGEELTLEMVGRVFRAEFWMLLVMALLDAQDAARAIQLATRRLRAGERVEAASEAPTAVAEVG